MHPVFRIASETDASDIAILVNKAYRPGSHERGWTHEADLVSGMRTSPDQVRSLFRPDSTVLVMTLHSKIVACAHLQNEHPAVSIGMLATDPALQAQGLGKQMLLHAERYAREKLNVSMFSMSVLSSRSELVAFYERRGYMRTGNVESYPISAGIGQPIVKNLQVEKLFKLVN